MFHITIIVLLRNLQHEAESYNKTFQEMGNILSPFFRHWLFLCDFIITFSAVKIQYNLAIIIFSLLFKSKDQFQLYSF